jgi:uncharacterized protein (TIGR02145 family)
MQKNLNVTNYRNGDTIPQATTPIEWLAYNALNQGCWAYPNYNSINGNTYGKLYNWHAVNDVRGLAPIGYHVPTYAEFQTLITCLGGSSVAGGKLKQTGLTTWQTPNTGATNSSGFTALGAGHINWTDGIFNLFNSTTRFITTNTWSDNSTYTLGVHLYYHYTDVNHFFDIINKEDGSSVRLIKN